MNVQQLTQYINDEFNKNGIDTPIEKLEVDAETYANVCQFIFSSKSVTYEHYNIVRVHLGKHAGVMYKGIELILKRSE